MILDLVEEAIVWSGKILPLVVAVTIIWPSSIVVAQEAAASVITCHADKAGVRDHVFRLSNTTVDEWNGREWQSSLSGADQWSVGPSSVKVVSSAGCEQRGQYTVCQSYHTLSIDRIEGTFYIDDFEPNVFFSHDVKVGGKCVSSADPALTAAKPLF
jgi:hypothetical protein